jgi:hypothetical protein
LTHVVDLTSKTAALAWQDNSAAIGLETRAGLIQADVELTLWRPRLWVRLFKHVFQVGLWKQTYQYFKLALKEKIVTDGTYSQTIQASDVEQSIQYLNQYKKNIVGIEKGYELKKEISYSRYFQSIADKSEIKRKMTIQDNKVTECNLEKNLTRFYKNGQTRIFRLYEPPSLIEDDELNDFYKRIPKKNLDTFYTAKINYFFTTLELENENTEINYQNSENFKFYLYPKNTVSKKLEYHFGYQTVCTTIFQPKVEKYFENDALFFFGKPNESAGILGSTTDKKGDHENLFCYSTKGINLGLLVSSTVNEPWGLRDREDQDMRSVETYLTQKRLGREINRSDLFFQYNGFRFDAEGVRLFGENLTLGTNREKYNQYVEIFDHLPSNADELEKWRTAEETRLGYVYNVLIGNAYDLDDIEPSHVKKTFDKVVELEGLEEYWV